MVEVVVAVRVMVIATQYGDHMTLIELSLRGLGQENQEHLLHGGPTVRDHTGRWGVLGKPFLTSNMLPTPMYPAPPGSFPLELLRAKWSLF